MQSFEKLGAFYLGKRFDSVADKLTEELVLYDSSDLTTHAVIIGMTGSGKTGLGIGLIEEAALDHVPVIAIDPKGDLGNLLLTFPALRPADFEPWVDARDATASGQTPASFATATASTWKKGLADWGQTPARIERLRQAADFALYTPGSTAGTPLAVLGEFAPPPAALREDTELVNERIAGTVNGLLALLDIEADPVTSPEHILLSTILQRSWADGRSLGLADLISAIQNPGFDKLGVIDLDAFYPARQRFELAMRLNGLLAAPGFDVWMQGDLLNASTLLFTETGKPKVSVVSVAHLNDAQRMFLVTLLLNELIAWMRMQPGSSSLRAILYMDEILGYLPPVANPPSKQLFLTLLKQARAYGLGLVLSTQNPVDLDYKALSNAGTWFIGRLQTERDKERVREGLESAAGAGMIGDLGKTLAGLGKRRFLLHNVHEKVPVVFGTRWVMSYLAGPLTRDQIKQLVPQRTEAARQVAAPESADVAPPRPVADDRISDVAPVLPPGIRQCFLPALKRAGSGAAVIYRPLLLATADVYYSNARAHVDSRTEKVFALELGEGDLTADFDNAESLPVESSALSREPEESAQFIAVPALLAKPQNLTTWERHFKRWLRESCPVRILKSVPFKLYSEVDETEADFRIRLQHAANEERDLRVGKLRTRYESKVSRLEERLRRARQALERESEQARGAKMDTAVSIGTAVLGALLGRRRVSSTSVNRAGTAMRKAGSARKQAGDVKRARETIGALEQELADLASSFESEVDALDDAFDAQAAELTEMLVKPKSTDIQIKFFGIGWIAN